LPVKISTADGAWDCFESGITHGRLSDGLKFELFSPPTERIELHIEFKPNEAEPKQQMTISPVDDTAAKITITNIKDIPFGVLFGPVPVGTFCGRALISILHIRTLAADYVELSFSFWLGEAERG
jgi:hypothetical protein